MHVATLTPKQGQRFILTPSSQYQAKIPKQNQKAIALDCDESLNSVKRVLSYQHRDSWEPARSCPAVSLASAAPAQVGKACPAPWSRRSPVNEIWGEGLNVYFHFFLDAVHLVSEWEKRTRCEQQWHRPRWRAWWRTSWPIRHPGNGLCSAESRAGWGTLAAASQTHLETRARVMISKNRVSLQLFSGLCSLMEFKKRRYNHFLIVFLLYPRLLHCYLISDFHNNRHIIEFSHTASGKFCPNRHDMDGDMVPPAWQQAVLPCWTCSPSSCKLDTFWETKAFFILAWMAWSVLRSSQSLSACKDQQQRVNYEVHAPVHTASAANEQKCVMRQQINGAWKEVSEMWQQLADTRLHVCRWRGAQDGGKVGVENRSQLIKEIHLYFLLSQLGAHGTGQLLLILHCSIPQDTGEPLICQASTSPHTRMILALRKYDWALEDTHHLKASWRFEATLPISS